MSNLARTLLVPALLALATCAPASRPVISDGAGPTPVVVLPAPSATTMASATADVAAPAPPPPDSASAGVAPSPPPTAQATVASALAPGRRATFRCFSWAHERDFSTDCYSTLAKCLTERQRMQSGARHPSECEPSPQAWCTTLVERGGERCFGDAHNCDRYRAFVSGNHLETTECVQR